MRQLSLLIATATFALAACNQPAKQGESAEDYAQRVAGNGSAAGQQPVAQNTAPSAPYTPPAPIPVPAEPDQGKCSVEKVEPFYGQPDSPDIRRQILVAVAPKKNVRFVVPGPRSITPDPGSDRLNVMIDVTGVVRTARCG